MAIVKAVASLPPDDLRQVYLFHDKAMVISYTSDYEPFIGFTMSYNDPDHRLYIHDDTFVLSRIAEALELQGRDIRGGRVFIESNYVYVKDLYFNHNVILFLDWQGNDPLGMIRMVYQQLLD